MMKEISKVEKRTLQGEIAGANVTIDFEQEEGKSPVQVNANAHWDGIHININYFAAGNTLTISVHGAKIDDYPKVVVEGVLQEIQKLVD